MQSFEELVNEAYNKIIKVKRTVLVLPPIESEISTTKQHWTNVIPILETIAREPNHFYSFIKSETGKEISWFSSDKSEGLIIHGKRQTKKDISHILMKYIKKYVTCSSCKNSNSTLTKENSIEKLECIDCGMIKLM
jgi:translation initiation factor 2 beta subunit (eIF-2beta)/eIF-5